MKYLILLSMIIFMHVCNAQDSTKIPPMVTAGVDQVIYYPHNCTTLRGAGMGVDSKIKSYYWDEVVTTNKVFFTNPKSCVTFVTGLEVGRTYIFRLKATDEVGNYSTDLVMILVTKL